jgi:hypothetical protein
VRNAGARSVGSLRAIDSTDMALPLLVQTLFETRHMFARFS